MKKGILGAIFVAFCLIVVCFVGGFLTETIPAGYVGVVYNLNGGIEDTTLPQGFHIVAPTQKIILYSVALEQSYMTESDQGDSKTDESFEIPSKEGTGLDVDVAFSYSYDMDRLAETFTRFRGQSGKEILRSFIKPKMQAWIKEITPEFTMMDIVSKQRGNVNATITNRLKERFDAYGIVIDNIALADVRPDKETSKAIKKKIKAQEELETAKVTAEQKKVEANRDKDVALIAAEKEKETAKINAEKAKIKAEGEAKARKVEAESIAAANKQIANSLTPDFIKYETVKRWNGVEPQFLGGDTTPIIDMRQNK